MAIWLSGRASQLSGPTIQLAIHASYKIDTDKEYNIDMARYLAIQAGNLAIWAVLLAIGLSNYLAIWLSGPGIWLSGSMASIEQSL